MNLFRGHENLLLLFAVVAFTAFAMMRVARRRRAHHADHADQHDLTPREKLERIRQQQGVKNDIEVLMVELEELSKRVAGRIDTKAVQIERLLRDADERIAELKRLEANADAPHAPPRGAASAKARDDLDLRSADNGDASAPAGATPATPAASDVDGPAADPLSRSVYQLADAGHDALDIARRLKEHVGKVELILALRKA